MDLRARAAAVIIAALIAAIMLVAGVYVVATLAALFTVMAALSIPLEKHRSAKAAADAAPAHVPEHAAGRDVRAAGNSPAPGELPRKSSIIVVACVILAATLPMGLNPTYNGEDPHQRNEYELMADSLIEGHLYLDYAPNKLLDHMENPYDTQARQALGVHVHWDSAYYHGKYYMYFGVVPAVLVFVPFKLIAGQSLTTYHATQLFTALYIIGLFFLMRLISRRFFRAIPVPVFYLLFAALALISTWYFAEAPALYCTAISAGVFFQTWGLYCFARAVWVERREWHQIGLAALGALCGALTVGCRPTVAIANLMAVPLLVEYLKMVRPSKKLVGQLLLVALPYVIVIGALMMYNHVRFGSFLEFGQSYQLTAADQHQYSDLLTRLQQSNMPYQFLCCTFGLMKGIAFPGIFWEYPLLLAVFFGRFWRASDTAWQMRVFAAAAVIVAALIIMGQTIGAPYLLERYKSDLLWLVCIGAFVCICALNDSLQGREREFFLDAVRFLSVFAMASCVVLFLVPNDLNLTYAYRMQVKSWFLHLLP
ncbi:MAG: hypothetical protein ACOX12_02325 [Eggerthellaceae bacterium]|jgi:hypothetical protein